MAKKKEILVPGARFAPRVPQILASRQPHDYMTDGLRGLGTYLIERRDRHGGKR
jgi:hypothetical protein